MRACALDALLATERARDEGEAAAATAVDAKADSENAQPEAEKAEGTKRASAIDVMSRIKRIQAAEQQGTARGSPVGW